MVQRAEFVRATLLFAFAVAGTVLGGCAGGGGSSSSGDDGDIGNDPGDDSGGDDSGGDSGGSDSGGGDSSGGDPWTSDPGGGNAKHRAGVALRDAGARKMLQSLRPM